MPRDRPAQIPIVARSPEYRSLFEALPNQSIVDFIKIHQKKDDLSNHVNKDTTQVKETANTMTKLKDLRALLVKMITGAKTLDPEYAPRGEIYAISDGLDELKWDKFTLCTKYIIYTILLGAALIRLLFWLGDG